MICFSDNDIIFKLADYDLLDDALETLGFSRADVFVLPDVMYRFVVPKRWAKSVKAFGEETAIRIKDFLLSVQVVSESPTIEDLALFEDHASAIHPGEQILLLSCLRKPGSYLITGDKNCLRSLGSESAFQELTAALRGRVLCLELIILRMIETLSYEYVKNKIIPAIHVDAAIRCAFGSRELCIESNSLYILYNCIKELKDLPSDILGETGFPQCEPDHPMWTQD